jgi:WD40 repeat protein
VPSLSPTTSPTLSPTDTPFIPANLVPIDPQNAFQLQPLAVLPEAGASVVAFSPDGRQIAAGLFSTNAVKAWDLASGQELLTLSGQAEARIVSYLAYSPDGAQLASGAQGWQAENDSLILWETDTGRQAERYSGVLGALSPDWRLVAYTTREQEGNTSLLLADRASGELLHTLNAPSDIYGISFSPQGEHVAAKMYGVFQDLFAFWSVESGRLEHTVYDWVGSSYAPDGRFIAALVDKGTGGDTGELNIFDAATFRWAKTLAQDADSLWYTSPAFSPDGQLLAASFGDHVILWETQSWTELATLPTSAPSGAAFSPDGRLLVTFTHKGPVQLWGVPAGP